MTDTTYPSSEQHPFSEEYPFLERYYSITAAYLQSLLRPYQQAISVAEDVESLTSWVPIVLPEIAEQLNDSIIQADDVEHGKLLILQALAEILVDPENVEATPWDIAGSRNEMAARLFGPSSDRVTVTVTTGPNTFEHYLTKELTMGIVLGLSGVPGFTVSIDGVPVDPEIYGERISNERDTRFYATVNGTVFYFGTPEFIQGVITAAQWINVSPHDLVSGLHEVTENNEFIPLDFQI